MRSAAANGKVVLRVVAIALAVLIVGYGIYQLFKLIQKPDQPRQVVHNISLIKQPPPPPPKPPDKLPPEPPKVKEEVKVPEDQPKPADKAPDDKPPSDKPLAVDAQGGAGSDGFGLAGRIGGKDLLSTGGGSGAYYTGLIQRQFYEALMRDKKIQHQEFKIVINIELGADGRVTSSNVVTGSGNHDLDQQIQTALANLPPLREVPPPSLREVELRLSNRI
jgi:protein TonB